MNTRPHIVEGRNLNSTQKKIKDSSKIKAKNPSKLNASTYRNETRLISNPIQAPSQEAMRIKNLSMERVKQSYA
jgi:hypothetical protein